MDNILELSDVTLSYSKGTPFERLALDHATCAFKRGRITGLIGHTGSGKSSLVSLLNGLYRPESGAVILDGKDIWEKPAEIAKVRFKVGLVMQYPEYQLFDETVRSDVGFAPRNLGLSAEEIEARVKDAIRFSGLDLSVLDKSPFELSGGQKRRVAIAGVIAMQPDVLVLDEPAAGLDPRGRREILGGLRAFAVEQGATVILVSHSMEDMALYCDDVVVMNDGKIHMSGTVEEIFSSSEELEAVGLDIPMVAKIALALKKNGINLEGTLYTVDGVRDSILEYIKEGKL